MSLNDRDTDRRSSDGILQAIRRGPPPAKIGEINYHLFDRFTFAHFVIGVGYSFMGFGFGVALLLSVLWEILENPLKVVAPWIFPNATADTLRNAFGDTLAVCAGWAVARYLVTLLA